MGCRWDLRPKYMGPSYNDGMQSSDRFQPALQPMNPQAGHRA